MQKTYDAIFEVADPIITNYKTDLTTHDYNQIIKMPTTEKFIHITRDSGTSLIQFVDVTQYNEPIPYLFAHISRKELVFKAREQFEAFMHAYPKSTIQFYDGEKVSVVDNAFVVNELNEYENKELKKL